MNFITGHQLTLLKSGREYFAALAQAIEQAEHEILLETYIFADDQTGQFIANLLCDAARRGVRVHVMVDGFGSREWLSQLRPPFAASGVNFLVYRPELRGFSFSRSRLRRLHRKLSCFDGRLAFVGGINIIDDLHEAMESTTIGDEPLQPRFDYAAHIRGPLIKSIHTSMAKLWETVSWAQFKHNKFALRPIKIEHDRVGPVAAMLALRDNIRHRRTIEASYLHAIAHAQSSILLANAYFLPGRRFRRALRDAARRGVQVRLLLQGRLEYALLHYATQSLYDELLREGIQIYEYQPGYLHAKVGVVDNHWSTVGSSNIDPFSLLLAREANLVVDDIEFNRELTSTLENALQCAVEMKPKQWRKRAWPHRLATGLARGLVRLAMGLAGYANRI